MVIETPHRRAEAAVGVVAICGAVLAPWLIDSLSALQSASASALLAATMALGFLLSGPWGRRRIVRIVWVADGRWMLVVRDGRAFEAFLHPQTRLAPGAVWLRWRTETGSAARYGALLTGADVDPEDLRRLVVRLRLEGIPDVGRRASPAAVAA